MFNLIFVFKIMPNKVFWYNMGIRGKKQKKVKNE